MTERGGSSPKASTSKMADPIPSTSKSSPNSIEQCDTIPSTSGFKHPEVNELNKNILGGFRKRRISEIETEWETNNQVRKYLLEKKTNSNKKVIFLR